MTRNQMMPYGVIIRDITGAEEGAEDVKFWTGPDTYYRMHHNQSCCETVYLLDISGDVSDLINQPITLFEERGSDAGPLDEYDESYTWTFYEIATPKGSATFRWYGTSNGYYSESVDFELHHQDTRTYLPPLPQGAIYLYGTFSSTRPEHSGLFRTVCAYDIATVEKTQVGIMAPFVRVLDGQIYNIQQGEFTRLGTSADLSEEEARVYARMLEAKHG